MNALVVAHQRRNQLRAILEAMPRETQRASNTRKPRTQAPLGGALVTALATPSRTVQPAPADALAKTGSHA